MKSGNGLKVTESLKIQLEKKAKFVGPKIQIFPFSPIIRDSSLRH